MSAEESPRERKRRLDAIFGDNLPEQTRDDLEHPTLSARGAEDAGDRWLREQVPPHHG